MIRRLCSALVLAAAVTATGCATLGAATDDDVVELRRRIYEVQQRTATSEEEIAALERRIGELEAALEEARGEDRGGAAAGHPVVEEAPVRAETPTRIEESDIEPPAPVSPSDEVSRPAPQSPSSVPREPPSATPAGRESRPVTAAGQELYDRGYTLFHQGRYVDAESTFQRFLQGWPDTELSDNAWYWIGEARFARDDVAGALAAFSEVVRGYPGGNKVPDALLKSGSCQERLGDVQGARATYEEVRGLFPDTAAAVSARERLEALR